MTRPSYIIQVLDAIAALLQAITPSSQLKLIDRLGVTQIKLIDRISPPSPSKKRVKGLNKTEGMRSYLDVSLSLSKISSKTCKSWTPTPRSLVKLTSAARDPPRSQDQRPP